MARRWAQALNLRRAGASFEQIASRLGYAGPSGAHRAVMGALDATLGQPAEELRALEAERLDRLMAVAWPKALAGDLKAVDTALRIMTRRARLLGLDAPVKVAPTTPEGRALPIRIVEAVFPGVSGGGDDRGTE